MTLTFAEEFAGIGGFHLGFTRAGMTSTFMGEILSGRQQVLSEHFPDVPLGGDINVTAASEIGRPSVLVGGFPCDGISKAQVNRLGLADHRSGEFYAFARLLHEYLRFIDSTRPRWVVIENPDGLLTSPGNPPRSRGGDGVDRTGWDMAAVTRSLEDLGYGWAYRVVDGRFLGTPQRRRRVLVVGHRGGDPRPAWQVLADEGAGGKTPAPSSLRRGPGRCEPRAVRPRGSDSEEDVLIWRKSSNPRAKLHLGGYETWVTGEYANTLTGHDWGAAGWQKTLMVQGGRVRAATITEWERLAGFPDGWTSLLGSDSARADALGDSMHPGMAEWLGRKLIEVDATLPLLPERINS